MADTPPLPEGTAQPKKSKLKKIVILISLLLLVGGLGGGAYWFISNDPTILDSLPFIGKGDETSEEGEQSEEEASEASSSENSGESGSTTVQTNPTTLVSLAPLTINLSDTGASKYLKVGIDIELNSAEAAKEIERQKARIRDAIIILLSSKSYSLLSTTTGKISVKNEIASRINQILQSPRVIQVYFTDFVVQ